MDTDNFKKQTLLKSQEEVKRKIGGERKYICYRMFVTFQESVDLT